MSESLLEKGTVTSDVTLQDQVSKTSALSGKAAFSWVSPFVVSHTMMAMAVSAAIYVPYHLVSGGVPTMGKTLHQVTGIVLGLPAGAPVVAVCNGGAGRSPHTPVGEGV